MTRILIVEDDVDIRGLLARGLEAEGFEVGTAACVDEALKAAHDPAPGAVLLDINLPDGSGHDVCRSLREGGFPGAILFLSARDEIRDRAEGLALGADDYIIKPFDPIELLARVKGTLRRAKEMRNLSPLTGLPGNIRIQEEIERQVREEREFAVLYCDLDNFKTYNDQKGFVRGDRLIQATARIIQDAVVEGSGAEGFVGHVGGDDFVAVVVPDGAEEIAKRICERFDEARAEFYEAEDLERGFVRGDRLIQATARIIQDAVVEGSGSEGFVGHVGGDDFVAVVIPDGAEDIAKSICERFDEARAEFYEAEDLDRGFVRMEDRKGVLQDIPLVAISIGIASTSKRQFAHYGEAVAVATEMKSFAKRDGGSSYAVDRRTEV